MALVAEVGLIMRPIRVAIMLFLASGVVFGYGSGIAALVHGHGLSRCQHDHGEADHGEADPGR